MMLARLFFSICAFAAAFGFAPTAHATGLPDGAAPLSKAPSSSILRLTQNSGGGYLPPDYNRAPRNYDDRAGDRPRDIAPRNDAYSPPPRRDYDAPPRDGGRSDYGPPPEDEGYSSDEVLQAGHKFFGTVSKSLAKVVEYTFSKQGRPNGYILGEEAGGAFVAGLRYGEGRLFTKYDGDHKVYWQGPSIGYDIGGEGSKTLILVYNLDYADQVFQRFAGVDGSAYLVGGVGVTFQKQGDVVMAPIRSGVGVRLGANVGYLKYTRHPTWNPF